MLFKEKTRLIVSSVLIIICLAFFSYRSSIKLVTPADVCETNKENEQQEIKVKTAVPLWETLSRHLVSLR
jgi:hypothetical protein